MCLLIYSNIFISVKISAVDKVQLNQEQGNNSHPWFNAF